MRATVHVHVAPAVGRADAEEDDFVRLGQVDDLVAIRRVPETRAARRLAARVRIVGLARSREVLFLEARLERNLVDRLVGRQARLWLYFLAVLEVEEDRRVRRAFPVTDVVGRAGELDPAIGPAR